MHSNKVIIINNNNNICYANIKKTKNPNYYILSGHITSSSNNLNIKTIIEPRQKFANPLKFSIGLGTEGGRRTNERTHVFQPQQTKKFVIEAIY